MSPVAQSAVHLLIHGRVQGVGYRYFAQSTASELALAGWVRNLPGGQVEALGQGLREDLETWITRLRQGPPLSRVEKIEIDWCEPEGRLTDFSIR